MGLFIAVGTQWRSAIEPVEGGFRSRWTGLDYGAVKIVAEIHNIALTPVLWADFALLEATAAATLNGGRT